MNAQRNKLTEVDVGLDRKRAVRGMLANRDMLVSHLAVLADYEPKVFKVLFSKGLRNDSTCFRVEAALGYELPLVSDLSELEIRRVCLMRNGWDPFLVTLQELIEKAKELGIPSSTRTRAELQNKVLERLAAQSQQKQPPAP